MNPPPNQLPNSNPNYNANSNYSYFTQQAIRAGYVTGDIRRRDYDGFGTSDVSRPQLSSYVNSDVSRPQVSSYVNNDVSRREVGGFMNADVRRPEYEYRSNPIDNRYSGLGSGSASGLSQREIEKEQIRKEIIAEELMRRRILEEEVRRELMFERDFPIRGEVGMGGGSMRVDPWRVPLPRPEVDYWGGFGTMPYARPVVGGGSGSRSGLTIQEIKEVKGVVAPSNTSRDKAIVLAKPRANLVDLKRKTIAPRVGDAIEVFKRHKPNDNFQWNCSICQVTTTSKQGLNDHFRGKKHQARASGTVGHKTGFGTEPLPIKISSNTVNPSVLPGLTITPNLKKNNHPLLKLKNTSVPKKGNGDVKGKGKAAAEMKKTFRYFCELCQVGAISTVVFDAHKRGKKHLANLTELEISAEKATTEENKKLLEKKLAAVKRGNVKGKAKPKTSVVDKPKEKLKFYCEMCKVGATSIIVFNNHKTGKKHLANISASLNQTEGNKDLINEDTKLTVLEEGGDDIIKVDDLEDGDVTRVDEVETVEVEGGDDVDMDLKE